jgi:hypothetical protein
LLRSSLPKTLTIAASLIAIGAIVAALIIGKAKPPDDGSTIAEQEVELNKRRLDLADAVKRYAPDKSAPHITDLATDAVALLRGLPGVARVDVAPAAAKPTARIVHLLDFHFVPRNLFAVDFKEANRRDLTDADWQRILLSVEMVQAEQAAAHHGLRQVLVEGLTEADLRGLARGIRWLFNQL